MGHFRPDFPNVPFSQASPQIQNSFASVPDSRQPELPVAFSCPKIVRLPGDIIALAKANQRYQGKEKGLRSIYITGEKKEKKKRQKESDKTVINRSQFKSDAKQDV